MARIRIRFMGTEERGVRNTMMRIQLAENSVTDRLGKNHPITGLDADSR